MDYWEWLEIIIAHNTMILKMKQRSHPTWDGKAVTEPSNFEMEELQWSYLILGWRNYNNVVELEDGEAAVKPPYLEMEKSWQSHRTWRWRSNETIELRDGKVVTKPLSNDEAFELRGWRSIDQASKLEGDEA